MGADGWQILATLLGKHRRGVRVGRSGAAEQEQESKEQRRQMFQVPHNHTFVNAASALAAKRKKVAADLAAMTKKAAADIAAKTKKAAVEQAAKAAAAAAAAALQCKSCAQGKRASTIAKGGGYPTCLCTSCGSGKKWDGYRGGQSCPRGQFNTHVMPGKTCKGAWCPCVYAHLGRCHGCA